MSVETEELLKQLKERGILDTLVHVTEPEVIERLSKLLLSDGTLRLLDHIDEVLSTLGELDQDAIEGLGKLISMLRTLNRMGVLDTLQSVLTPEIIGSLIRYLMGRGLLRLIDGLETLADALGQLEFEKVEGAMPLIKGALEGIPEQAEKVGLLGLLGKLRDKDIQRGLGVVMEILKAIGKTYAES